MTLLKAVQEDPEVKKECQYAIDLRDKVEETCKLARDKLTN